MLQRKKCVFGVILISIFAIGVYFMHGSVINQTYQGRAWSIEQVISEFIKENNGHFPKDQQELIDKGYIKIEYENGEPKYFKKVKYGDKTEWNEWPVHLEWFTIQYGAQKENILLADDILYDKTTNKRIFLIDGPYNRSIEPSLRRTYNMVSIKWYEEMKN